MDQYFESSKNRMTLLKHITYGQEKMVGLGHEKIVVLTEQVSGDFIPINIQGAVVLAALRAKFQVRHG